MSSKAGGPFTSRILSNEVKHDSGMEFFGRQNFTLNMVAKGSKLGN